MITALNLSFSLPNFPRPNFPRRVINPNPRRRILSPTISAAAGGTSTAGRTSNMTPPPPATTTTLYDVLGLTEAATIREIRSAYRIQARTCHPDASASTGGSADEFLRLHEAYSVISDPTKRAEYDRELNASRIRCRSPTRVYRFSGNAPRRTWETDQCW